MSTRVLLWSPGFLGEIGGIESLARPMVASLHGRGVEYRIMATNTDRPDDCTLTWQGVTVHSLPLYDALYRKDLAAFARARRRVREIEREFDPHVVHVNHHHGALVVHCDNRAEGRPPMLYTAHGWGFLTSEGGSHESLIGRLIRSADWVVGCSQSSVEAVRSNIPEAAPYISLIRNAMPVPPLEPTSLPWDPPVLLCVGRLVEQKGFDTAIEAMARIEPDARLLIAGYGPDETRLRALIDERGLGDRITMLGGVATGDVPALINRVTAVLMPSRGWEGLPMVAVEAALMGRPLIASVLPGLDEALVPDETGLAVAPDDCVALAAAIRYLLDHRDHAQKLGLQARERALREFGWEKYTSAYAALYERLARRENRAEPGQPIPAR